MEAYLLKKFLLTILAVVMVFSSIAPGVYASTQAFTLVNQTQIDSNEKIADLIEIQNLETLISDNNLKMDGCYLKLEILIMK
jgi:hypothetical protein